MKFAIFLADGFETCEGLITVDMLRRAALSIDTISMNETLEVTTSHGIRLQADRLFCDFDAEEYDVLIMPGGKLGTVNLEANERLKAIFKARELDDYVQAASALFTNGAFAPDARFEG